LATAFLLFCLAGQISIGQSSQASSTETTEQKVQRLTAAVAQAQVQMDSYQKQLQDLQQQLVALRRQLAAEKTGSPSAAVVPAAAAPQSPYSAAPQMTVANADTSPSAPITSDEVHERQALEESQIATLDQVKVETTSKFPLKVSGLILFNGFVNTRQVDVPPDPTFALPGSGSSGFSLQQTVLGLDARGPHLFGATSHADVRVDFFANGSQYGYQTGSLLRLRTAHATLTWPRTEAFVELDRPLISPNVPTSLVATAQPVFAWSGNLWTWNPQVGVSQQLLLAESKRLKLQAALIDVADPPLPNATITIWPTSLSEFSRWPGTEARIAYAAGESGAGPEIGVGGYFSPHQTTNNVRFNAWASSVDLRLPLYKHFELTANAYRGEALGGLGGGGYVDYLDEYIGGMERVRPLDDVGGWTQLKGRVGTRLEFNGGFGIDNPFAGEIRAATYGQTQAYVGLARNRSIFGNVIYSPSAYLLFSLEYRRLWTNYITGPTNLSNVIGVGAGYRF
jgi:hypothetical protein